MPDPDDPKPAAPTRVDPRARIIVIVAVVAVFAILLVVKALDASPAAAPATMDERPASAVATATASGGPSRSRGDAVAAYQAALKAGKPVYVLFHSTTCAPCVEISAIADEVIPGYADKITFVDAVTDDPGARELASGFSFQYIPTSFFLKADGTVTDSFTGVLTAEQMRTRLDTLLAQ